MFRSWMEDAFGTISFILLILLNTMTWIASTNIFLPFRIYWRSYHTVLKSVWFNFQGEYLKRLLIIVVIMVGREVFCNVATKWMSFKNRGVDTKFCKVVGNHSIQTGCTTLQLSIIYLTVRTISNHWSNTPRRMILEYLILMPPSSQRN